MITKLNLIRDLEDIGVRSGDTLNVKASLRSIGEIQGGANTLIEALMEVVGEKGTIVTESFIRVASPLGFKFWKTVVDTHTSSYAGGLANAMLTYPGAILSAHPVQRFAVLGFRAKELAEAHTKDSYAYEILHIMAKTGGKNLKIGDDKKVPGVGTTHVAIGIRNIRQKRPLAGVRFKDSTGNNRKFSLNWAGGCLAALYNLNPLYDRTPGAILGRAEIGSAPAKLSSMRVTLDAELESLKDDPASFLRCGNPDCITCKFSWEKYQDSFADFLFNFFLKEPFRLSKMKRLAKALQIKFLFRYRP